MKWNDLFTKQELIHIAIVLLAMLLTWLVFLFLMSGCANKDWYIHLRAKPEMPVDFTLGRGSSHTVQAVTTNDDTQ